MIHEWSRETDDPDSGPVFWLALADTQWRCGRLDERVKARALAIIANKSDLERWQHDQALLRKRATVLKKLAEEFMSPAPPAKKLPRVFQNQCDWKVGEMVAYELSSGQKVIFRVIGYHKDKGGMSPVCELMDWVGDQVPGKLRLVFTGICTGRGGIRQFLIGRLREKELPASRITRLNAWLPPSQRPNGYTVFLWRYLDKELEEIFGLK